MGNNSKEDHTLDSNGSKKINVNNIKEIVNDADEIYSEDDYHSLHISKYTCSNGSHQVW